MEEVAAGRRYSFLGPSIIDFRPYYNHLPGSEGGSVRSVPNWNTMLRRLVFFSLSGRDVTVDKMLIAEASPTINGGDALGCLRGEFRVGATLSAGRLASAISHLRTLSED